MTATRDRRSDLDEDHAEPAWDERPILGTSRGLPWWGAVLLAFGLAAAAAYFDMDRQNSLGRIYQGAYVVGCVGAVCWVRRRNLFGPMVQPPLVFAITAIAAVIWFLPDSQSGTSIKQLIFSVALPLTSNFPTMALTTGVTVAIGLLRMWLQRNPHPEIRPNRRQTRDARAAGTAGRQAAARREPADRTARDRAGQQRSGRARAEQDRDGASSRGVERGRRASRNARENGRDSTPRADRGRPDHPGRPDQAARGDQARRRDPGTRGGRQRRDDRSLPDHRDGSDHPPPSRQPRRRPPDNYR